MVNIPQKGHGNSLPNLSWKAVVMGILEPTPSLLLAERQSTPLCGSGPGLCLWMDGGFTHPANLLPACLVQSFVEWSERGCEEGLGMALGLGGVTGRAFLLLLISQGGGLSSEGFMAGL